ncbi:hypothetical protein [Eupransor demetentiae]|uniref:Uncharacterized protein n=1 Tax=Eupransor demetentiae TaxID=3109584 RepID=A0ABM9N4R6_9LACO|nr:hypothetical protein R54876_GBNLAHCA_00707 [Lactobacillaceae bacterium LMG 33000]
MTDIKQILEDGRLSWEAKGVATVLANSESLPMNDQTGFWKGINDLVLNGYISFEVKDGVFSFEFLKDGQK